MPFDRTASLQAVRRSPVVTVATGSYEPDPQAPTVEIHLETIRASHTVYSLITRSEGENRQPDRGVTGRYYRANRSGRRPLIVILPIWGASRWPARTTVKHLLSSDRSREIDLLALDGPNYLFDWAGLRAAVNEVSFWERLDQSVTAFEVTVRDVRRILRWAAERGDVDSQRIGLIGYSIGAILGTVVLAHEPRVSAAALVMGGGHLEKIMATCPRRLGKARRNMLELTGWSVATYESELRPFLAGIDSVRWASSIDPSRVLMIDAGDDGCMPPPSRDDLWEALGRPHRITLPFNHRYSFLTMTPVYRNWSTRRIVRFLEDKLFPATSAPVVSAVGAGLD